jgi:hypothetical protein
MDQSLQTLGPSSIQPALQRSPRHVRHNRRYRVHAVWTVQVESKQETPTAEPLFGENDEGLSEPRVSTRTMTRPGQSETMTRLHGGAPRGDWRRALEQGRRDVAQAARCYVCGVSAFAQRQRPVVCRPLPSPESPPHPRCGWAGMHQVDEGGEMIRI